MRPSRPLSVVHVIDSLLPGGTERQCVELVRASSPLGVRSVVVYFRPGPLLAELDAGGVTARALPEAGGPWGRFPLAVLKLAAALRRDPPHVVQTYGFHSNVRGLAAAALARVPVRIAGRRELARGLTPAQRRADRCAWRLADRIVANSEAVRRQLIEEERVPPGQVVVIRNGLSLQPWRHGQPAPHGNGDLVVGMVAHFREDKDHLTFLRAASEVLTFAPSVRFRLVGSGGLEPAAREWARRLGVADRVEFLGRLDGEALRAAVRGFRVSVLASKTEGLPNTALESMAAARPLVATAVGGTREVVEDGVTGFLVPPEDPLALAERIVRLLKDPPLADDMGRRGLDKVEREFSADRMAREFRDLYGQLLAAGRSR